MRSQIAYLDKDSLIHIISFLSKKDQYSCIRVNRHWSLAAVKCIYRELLLTNETFVGCLNAMMKGTMHPYGHYIELLSLHPESSQGVEIGDLDVFFLHARKLKSLCLKKATSLSIVIVMSICGLTELVELDLNGSRGISINCLEKLLWNLPRLIKLDLTRANCSYEDIKECEIAQEGIECF